MIGVNVVDDECMMRVVGGASDCNDPISLHSSFVVALNLNGNTLKGSLPTEFGLLTKLSKFA